MKTESEISYNMSRIKGKDTTIEKILRTHLYQQGYRYRKNVSSLPGHPDIVMTKYKIAIFCDGDFFHGYNLRKISDQLKKNKEYWYQKIRTNQKRDLKNDLKLVLLGYTVLHFWEHEIRNDLPRVLNEIESCILSKQAR